VSSAVTAFAPASISNFCCGFDVLGAALAEPGDGVTVRRTERPGVHLVSVTGDDGRLPREPEANTASVAAKALLRAAGHAGEGVEVELEKGLPLASGLGSSAASAVAAAVAVDALLGLGSPEERLLRAALEGERVACGAVHADNAAPCLYGGFVLVRSTDPLDVVRLEVPDELWFAMLHPRLEVPTREARNMLPRALPLSAAVTQWANLGALVAALLQGDWELMGRALVDVVAEPVRARLVPGFDAVTAAARDAGAAGAGLSGSGPSLFAVCRGEATARRVAATLETTWRRETGEEARSWASPLNRDGAAVLCESEPSRPSS
jgi:homoserine kinase